MEERELVAGIHKALDTYEIEVNGAVNETKPLTGWVQTLVTDTRELRNLTRDIRRRQELRRARTRYAEALAQTRTGRALAAAWRAMRVPVITAAAGSAAYYVFKVLLPGAFAAVRGLFR